MKEDALKFNEDNKDKPHCQGRVYVGSGRGGAHWETCKQRKKCKKYKNWIEAGMPLINYKEHVNIHLCSVRVFRLCFLYNV